MKPPRIFARAGYFWIRYYLPGNPNPVREATGIAIDRDSKGAITLKLPAAGSRNFDWWKKSKSAAKLQKLLEDVSFKREAVTRGVELAQTTKPIPDLQALLTEFNEVNAIERDRERSPATLKHRQHAVDFLMRWLHNKPWFVIDRATVLELRTLAKGEYSATSIRGYFTVLRMLFDFAVRESYVSKNPFSAITVTVPKTKPLTVESKDEKRLLEFLYHKNRRLFDQLLFQRLTGLRVNEVCQLQKDAIKAGVLHFHNSKAHRDEELPLSAAARYLLTHRKAPDEKYLFEFRNKKTVSYYLQRSCEFAGVPPIRTHQLKRNYLQEVAKIKPDARTFDALAHHAASVNRVAVDHYSGRDIQLMREALEEAQKPWLRFLKELPKTRSNGEVYSFANPNSNNAKRKVG